jgi:dienelactone hydrolase
MKKFLGILVLGLLLCNTGFSVESLKESQKGRIKFQSIPLITLNQFLKGDFDHSKISKWSWGSVHGKMEGPPIKISGSLQFPSKKWTGRLPAVVLLHGGGGPRASVKYWSKVLRKIGLVTFTVDSNTARGCGPKTRGTCPNYGLNQGMANIVDAYRALELLSTHPRIDSTRIAVMGFSVGGKASLYASVKRFQKMWGTPGLEFAAYVPFYPACNITFDHDEKISDQPIRIFYGELDEWSSPIPCEKYVNRLRKAGKDITITIYPGAHHNFDAKGDANAPSSIPGDSRINCRFVEKAEYNLVVLEKDKDNKELETLYSQCIALYPNRKHECRLNAYSSLKTSNIYSAETYDYFASTIKNIKENSCKMKVEDTTAREKVTTKEETKPVLEEVKALEKIKATLSESDKRFAESVEKFIKKEWGESDWEMGFIQCMISHTASLSKEVKEVVIEYGPEKAFRKISNQEDEMVYNKLFKACEKGAEAALKEENKTKEETAAQETTSKSFSETNLPALLESLENQLVKQVEYYKTMSFLLADTSCIAKSKKRLKYNKEAAENVKKAVTDFFITTFEITSPL